MGDVNPIDSGDGEEVQEGDLHYSLQIMASKIRTFHDNRKDDNIIITGILCGVFNVFATVPYGIRQRSWRLAFIPFAVSTAIGMVDSAIDPNNEDWMKWNSPHLEMTAYFACGSTAAALAYLNKKEEEESDGRVRG
ncbi:VanZ family protein [Synechococcus sp. MIT S9503]|uniref:VanZ family protein n=1 Tax=Synechococcus sp. MIT S9503 TaxID=3082547 RepID=UPI0039A540B7